VSAPAPRLPFIFTPILVALELRSPLWCALAVASQRPGPPKLLLVFAAGGETGPFSRVVAGTLPCHEAAPLSHGPFWFVLCPGTHPARGVQGNLAHSTCPVGAVVDVCGMAQVMDTHRGEVSRNHVGPVGDGLVQFAGAGGVGPVLVRPPPALSGPDGVCGR
jgi:hypothetical protein